MKKRHDGGSAVIRDVILGGQDGLVNVLGIVLAVATATQSRYIVLISGLAATFAESFSMAAVAYTSAKAGKEFYLMKNVHFEEFAHPIRDALVVGLAAIVGSFVPLLPFIFVPVGAGIWFAVVFSVLALFITGALKARFTAVNPWKSGFEMMLVGMAAAIAGYVIGYFLGVLPLA
ncbi:VIT1/CCC1 transporter family protein [Candidatus Woesearchaeota archaeon]|nr:VIT1/CCC1 transporter family protein [Candidatus Woesearchaeota archaeon]